MISPHARLRITMKWPMFASIAVVLACAGQRYEHRTAKIQRPKGVDRSASVFRAKVQAAFPITQTHDRPRPGDCKKCVVIVHIDVLGDTRTVNPDNAPATGFPIAHLENVDDKDSEAYFNLRPHSTADYYIWVDDDGTKKSRYTLLELAADTVGATKQWKVTLCHAYGADNPRGPSDFDFYEFRHGAKPCTTLDVASRANINYASLLPAIPIQPFLARIAAALRGKMMALRGTWIECGSGCCT
jgi:hypothetical protein